MKMNVYLKGGPMHGEWVETEVEQGDKYLIYRDYIQVIKFPEVHFTIQDFESPKPCEVAIERLTYKLVRKSNGFYYEYYQATSGSTR
jgi:hypothetical protein